MAGRIVVGVDGSELGAAALRWAVEEARVREAALVAVHAWTFVPPAPIAEPGMLPIPGGELTGDLEAERRAAQTLLDDAVAGAIDQGVRVEPLLVEATPGEAIVAAAADADLVVVGSHGRGSLASALLGSVSHHVVRHAPCPVVIVRPGES
jgi:nucleotide-binding universal stress UspA family protein